MIMKKARPRLFNDVIAKMYGGQLSQDLDQAMVDCVNASRASGKKAKLVLTLTLDYQAHEGNVKMTDKVSTTLPKPDRGSIMDATTDGNLKPEELADPATGDLLRKPEAA
jgi:hypothetical protein